MNKRRSLSIMSLILALVMMMSTTNVVFAVDTLPDRTELSPSFGLPTTYPTKGEHPRVMLTKKDLPNIRANMESPEGMHAVSELNKLLADDVDGKLPEELNDTGSNFDYNVLPL